MLDNGRRLQILKFLITGTKDIYSDMYQRNYVMAPITYKSLTPMVDTILEASSLKGGFIKPIDLSLIHISEPTRRVDGSRMPSSA